MDGLLLPSLRNLNKKLQKKKKKLKVKSLISTMRRMEGSTNGTLEDLIRRGEDGWSAAFTVDGCAAHMMYISVAPEVWLCCNGD